MRKIFLPAILGCLSLSFVFLPVSKAGSKNASVKLAEAVTLTSPDEHTAKGIDERSVASYSALLYDSLHLGKLGLQFEALKYAYTGYLQLRDRGALGANGHILTVCDFSQSSRKKRMYIIDVKHFKVLLNTYVAHGKNSGLDYANEFSNTPESLQSSLGFFVTTNTYFGKHGLSLKLDGQERGWNDKAEERAVVVHGADYIGAHRLGAAYMGRSFGCPAVPAEQSDKVINMIKNGSCLFIYHPSTSYLHGSRLING